MVNSTLNISLVVCLVIVFFISNHLMDLGDVSYDLGFRCDHIKTYTTNGMFNVESSLQYHVSWYISYFCFIIMSLIALRGMANDKKN